MQTHRALGKGLASLIPVAEAPLPTSSENYFECPIEDILPCRDQPRKIFAKQALEELAASIRAQGLLQPLIVRKIEGGKFELIAGERRLRASKIAGLSKVHVVVNSSQADKVFELALIENIQREDLNPIEEALAYRELQEKYRLTQEEIAGRVGKERSSVANSLRLLALPEEIRGDIIESRLSMGHARALLSLESIDDKLKLRNKIIQEGLSVRDVEELVRNWKESGSLPERRRTKSRGALDPQIQLLEDKMTQSLGTRVQVKTHGNKGKIVIDYYNLDDLDRVYQLLSI